MVPTRQAVRQRRGVLTIRKILIIDGHPDPSPDRFVHALAEAYAEGAEAHEVRRLKLGELDIPFVRSAEEWTKGEPSAAIASAQSDIVWAEHIVILYPLWLGDVPALLKAFLEQVMRPGFAFGYRENKRPEKLLKGRTARIVVTMGMPTLFYKLVYGAHSVKSLERNILKFVGIRRIERMILGSVEADEDRRRHWLDEMRALGAEGA